MVLDGDGAPTDSSGEESVYKTSSATLPRDATRSELPMATSSNGRVSDLDSHSDSDMSMSADSDDDADNEEQGLTPLISKTGNPMDMITLESSRKRKLSISATFPVSEIGNHNLEEGSKRLKVDSLSPLNGSHPPTWAELPAEIWHQILTYCTPKVLGRLLRLNKEFNAWLSASVPSTPHGLSTSSSRLMSMEEIWRASRNRFFKGAPGPLLGTTELQMWQLACGKSCQRCGRSDLRMISQPTDPWHAGPGVDGISPIWQFHARSCGSCLHQDTIKEIDLLLSAAIPPSLKPALPFIFLTNELHVIPSTMLQTKQHPPALQISKYFLKSQIEDLKKEFENVKFLGSAATEEWVKGLDSLGKQRRNDAARWERWEVVGGLIKMQQNELEGLSLSNTAVSSTASTVLIANSAPRDNASGLQGQVILQPPSLATNSSTGNIRVSLPPIFNHSQQTAPPHSVQRSHQPRTERTKEQVAELRAHRRQEIERRSRLLDPPLLPEVLAHMPSFQAAMQLTQPLTDAAWELLQPRLLSQRQDAERREEERVSQLRVLQGRMEVAVPNQTGSEARIGATDAEWEEVQAPLRSRIANYADEIINDGWSSGRKVNFQSCPLFAADVLVYVRKRFYAEVAKDEAATRAIGKEPDQDPPEGPYTKRLILENMKWIFESKIKPITEPIRKELFLCNDCDFPARYYGFEGMIQHYAAKHTNTMSLGSVVVHWKFEWPQHTPFSQDPDNSRSVNSTSQITGSTLPYGGSAPGLPQSIQMLQAAPIASPVPYSGPPFHQAPIYQNLGQYQHQYGSPSVAPQYPSSTYSPYSAQHYAAIPPSTSNGYGAHVGPHQHYYGLLYGTPTVGNIVPPPQVDAPSLHPVPDVSVVSAVPPQPYTPTGSHAIAGNQVSLPQPERHYKLQLQHLARIARELWTVISGIKEVPGSVKVHTFIYHIVARFRAETNENLRFSMLADGLNNHKDMRPVRNVNGLLCRACVLELPGAISLTKRKHLSFPQLVNHFLSAHEETASRNSEVDMPDWTKQLVELPDLSKLRAIPSISAMDDQRLKIYGEALPEMFSAPSPIPTLAILEQRRDIDDSYYFGPSPQPRGIDMAPSKDRHDKYYIVETGDTAPVGVPLCSQVDEYDPRKPGDINLDAHLRRDNSLQQRSEALRFDAAPTLVSHGLSAHNQSDRRPESLSSLARSHAEYSYSPPRQEIVYTDPQYRVLDSDAYENVRQTSRSTHGSHNYIPSNEHTHHSNQRYAQQHITHQLSTQERSANTDKDKLPAQNNVIEILARIQEQAKLVQEEEKLRPQPLDIASDDAELSLASPTKQKTLSRGKPQQYTKYADSHGRAIVDEQYGPRQYLANEKLPLRRDTLSKDNDSSKAADNDRVRLGGNRVNDMPLEQTTSQRNELAKDERPSTAIVRDKNIAGITFPTVLRNGLRETNYQSSLAHVETQRHYKDITPVPVDPRYKQNNTIVREESVRRTPARYARYESVRLEQERERESGRSKSPARHIASVPQRSQLREASLSPAPFYRTRSPIRQYYTDEQEPIYERGSHPRRQEYHRIYANNNDRVSQRVYERREPQYEDVYEYVRVADSQGDYMIRQHVGRRRVIEPVYYEDEVQYDQQGRRIVYVEEPLYSHEELRRRAYDESIRPVYESSSRRPEERRSYGRQSGNGAEVEGQKEEYDPKHPEPLGDVPLAQRIRYQ